MGKDERHPDADPSQEVVFIVYLLFGVCLEFFWLIVFNFVWVVGVGLWVIFFECVEDILITLFIIIIVSNGLSYKDSLVLLWNMDGYIFQELHWKICAVCHRKTVFVFKVATTVFVQETLMWFTKSVQTFH